MPPAPDKEHCFLLPLEENPTCTLRYLLSKSRGLKAHKKNDEGEQNEDDITPDPRLSNVYYSVCDVTRTQTSTLLNGDFKANAKTPKTFRFTVGDFVLLCPEDNSFRPGVARVMSFFYQPKSDVPLARVRWFYRGEDLSGRPTEAVGEDEVFETGHCDDVEAATIRGRCTVTSYPDWIVATTAQLSEGDDGNTGHADEDMVDEMGMEGIRAEYDSDEDAKSSFMANYNDASVRYYCRRYYEQQAHVFVNSQFECPDADPQEELANLRELEAQAAEESDYEAEAAWSGESDDDAEDDREVDVEELEDLREATPEKKRAKAAPPVKKRKGRRHKGESAQFAMPLQLGNTEVLPCRDDQKAQVRNFLMEMINDPDGEKTHGSRCMYISGVPGTGKTATVREVLHDLQRKRSTGEVGSFEVIEVNAMSLPDPALVYSELYAVVTGNRGIAPMHAAQLLEKRFSDLERDSGKRAGRKGGKSGERNRTGCVVVMLDEMDILLSRKQKVLYDLLEWPSRRDARLAVIGIANTMDLPERMLPRLASRIGLNRLCYPPYTSGQITEILNLTLKKDEVAYDDSAIRLCATKVGAVSGDVRRAFELCRRAAEIMAEEAGGKGAKDGKVTAAHVNKAIQAVAGNARLAALEQLSPFEKVVLVSSLYIARSEGSFNLESMCSMEAVCEKAREFAMAHRETFKDCSPSTFELQEACWRLAGQRLVLIEKAIVPRLSRVIVNLSPDDCAFGLRTCEFSTSILTGQLGIKPN